MINGSSFRRKLIDFSQSPRLHSARCPPSTLICLSTPFEIFHRRIEAASVGCFVPQQARDGITIVAQPYKSETLEPRVIWLDAKFTGCFRGKDATFDLIGPPPAPSG